MNKGNHKGPHAAGIQQGNAKTPPASPECASALPGDVGDDRARLCARFRRRPPLGSFKTLGAHKVPEHAGGQKPPAYISLFKTPHQHRTAWNESRPPPTPPRCRKAAENHENAAGVAKKRFGTFW